MREKRGQEHYGSEIRESLQEKASRIIRQELVRLGWNDETPQPTPERRRQQTQIALRLRQETTMTLKWIAASLKMGTKTHLPHLIYWYKRNQSDDTKNRP